MSLFLRYIVLTRGKISKISCCGGVERCCVEQVCFLRHGEERLHQYDCLTSNCNQGSASSFPTRRVVGNENFKMKILAALVKPIAYLNMFHIKHERAKQAAVMEEKFTLL